MPTYIQSFEDGNWCVNNEPRQIHAGQVVAFEQGWEADHFVKHGRAGLIGDFGDDAMAHKELERLVAENERLRAAAEAEQGSVDNQPEPEEKEVKDRETKAVPIEGMETSQPAAQLAAEAPKQHAHKGKKAK